MKRLIFSALVLSAVTANAQVGINTDNPKATLHVESKDPAHKTEGIMFPKATQDEMTNWGLGAADAGIMVFNTSQSCLELWDGTKWVNQCGGRRTVPPGPPTPPGPILPAPAPQPSIPALPSGLVLGDSGYYIASIYDENYLPYTANTGPAAFGVSNPDGYDVTTPGNPHLSENTVINVEGRLDNTGIEVGIPIKSLTSGGDGTTLTITSFSVYSRVPRSLTQNNQDTDIELHFPAQTFVYGGIGTERRYIKAILRAKDPAKPLLVKKLDMNIGNGADYRGIPLAEFKYFGNSNKSDIRTFYFNAVTGIPDRHFDEPQNTFSGPFSNRLMHRFIYVPAYGWDGKVWLNNNLGANYANLDNTAKFNPNKQAESLTDYNAYGSLFQWGRVEANKVGLLGHELVHWTSGTTGAPKIPALGWTQNWSGSMTAHVEYCPAGFKTPTPPDWDAYLTTLSRSSSNRGNELWVDVSLRLPAVGQRDYNSGFTFLSSNFGSFSWYWASTGFSDRGHTMRFVSNGAHAAHNDYKSHGLPVRCIKQ